MAADNPPFVLQASSHPADVFRRVLADISPDGGVIGPGDLKATANGTPNMSVNVAAGSAIVQGTEVTRQGAYHVVNDATVNLTIAASDPTNPRHDLVVAKVEDAEYSGATNAWSLAVVTGTPAASPADPATPANAILLARVLVDAAAATIVAGKITDLRDYASIVKAPRGTLDYEQVTANQGAITAETDLTGLAVTVTADTNRRVKITGSVAASSSVVDDEIALSIKEGATTLQIAYGTPPVANRSVTLQRSIVIQPSGGAHTYKLSLQRLVGTGNVQSNAGATLPAFILAEDIGPAPLT